MNRIGLHFRVKARQEIAHERLALKGRLALRLRLGAFSILLRGQRRVGNLAHFEGEQQLAPGGLLERRLELVRIRLVGKMAMGRR